MVRTRPTPNGPVVPRSPCSFVLNYEEGGEKLYPARRLQRPRRFCLTLRAPSPGPVSATGTWNRFMNTAAVAGFWRLHRLFTGADIPLTIYGVATALARSPEQVAAMKAADWEIASHGLKWVDHKDMPRDEERAAIAEAIRLHTEVVGTPPRGWYTGRSSVNTVNLVAEAGGFDYISDAYNDDLPYWIELRDRDQLIIPYTIDTNDMRFCCQPRLDHRRAFLLPT